MASPADDSAECAAQRFIEGLAELAADLILAGEMDSLASDESDPDAILQAGRNPP